MTKIDQWKPIKITMHDVLRFADKQGITIRRSGRVWKYFNKIQRKEFTAGTTNGRALLRLRRYAYELLSYKDIAIEHRKEGKP